MPYQLSSSWFQLKTIPSGVSSCIYFMLLIRMSDHTEQGQVFYLAFLFEGRVFIK